MSRISRQLLICIQVLISVGFVALLLRSVDLGQVAFHLGSASLSLLLLSLITKAFGFGLMVLRLRAVARAAGSISLADSFRAQSISFVGNNVLPLRLGEGLKVGYMANLGLASFSTCMGVAVVERILDAVFLVLFIGGGLLFFSELIPTEGTILLFTSVSCSAFAALFLAARFPDRFVAVIDRLTGGLGEPTSVAIGEGAARFARGLGALAWPRLLVSTVGLTAGYWAFSALSIHVWFAAFSIDVPWYAALVVLIFVSISTVIPAAPGFIGTYHYFAALALGLFGVTSDLAVSFAIVGHAVAIIPFTILLAPLVATDVVALHREGVPKLVQGAQVVRASLWRSPLVTDEVADKIGLG